MPPRREADQDLEEMPDVMQEVERFDVAALAAKLRDRRGGLSQRQAAARAGVSYSTFSRVEAGSQPDLASFTKLCAWLGEAPSQFFTPVAARRDEPLTEVIAHLTADPRLSAENSQVLVGTLRKLYDALASDEPEQTDERILAMHLRAAPVMRPGVPHRLSHMLTEMHERLEHLIDTGQL
jgi:transcriptional regulator with XRE-family HTH domain